MMLILSFCHSKWQFHHLYQRQTHLISCCSMSKSNSLKRSLFSFFVCQCCRLRFCLCFTCLSVSSSSQRMFQTSVSSAISPFIPSSCSDRRRGRDVLLCVFESVAPLPHALFSPQGYFNSSDTSFRLMLHHFS